MNTFAFVRNTEQKTKSWMSKYLQNHGMMDLFKVGILFVSFLFIIFIYLYYVNLASTRGYFLRQANQDYDAVNFQFEIVKTQLLSLKQENWAKIHNWDYQHEVIKLKTEIVYVPENSDLAYNQ